MNKLFIVMLLSVCLIGCSKEDHFPLTEIEGCPSSFKYSDKSQIKMSYRNGRIHEIVSKYGGYERFDYDGNQLAGINLLPTKGMADGGGHIKFRLEREKYIVVESWYEPNTVTYIEVIELNENNLPIKITHTGGYMWNGTEFIPEEEGRGYSIFSYDADNNLIGKEIHIYESSHTPIICSFEYDTYAGVTSRINLPEWFLIYRGHQYHDHVELDRRILLNYKHNLQKEIIHYPNENTTTIVNYQYIYNDNTFPIQVAIDTTEEQTLTIQY